MIKFLAAFLFSCLAFGQSNSTYIKGPTLIQSISRTVSSGAALNLVASSNTNQEITGTSAQVVNLPSGTTLSNGREFEIKNSSTLSATINDGSGSLLATVVSGSHIRFVLYSNGSVAGSWMAEPNSAGGGGVTSVTASVPIASSGGATPNITITQSGAASNGYLSQGDWNIFNNKFDLPSLTSGSILFSDGVTIVQDNAHLFWDNSAKSLNVTGVMAPTNSVVDTNAVAFFGTASTNTTVDGSNITNGMQTSGTALVQAGAMNDKALSGAIYTVQRGDGTDDGVLDGIAGDISLVFIDSGVSGVTNKGYGHASVLITNQGTMTDWYDFYSQRAPAGGTLTNHYGVYISDDSTSPVKNWLSGSSKLGGSSYSANDGLFWDNSIKRLEINGPDTHGGNQINIDSQLNETDPATDFGADHDSGVSLHMTANSSTALYNHYASNKVLIDTGITAGGGNINYGGHIDRSDAADLGTSGILAGSYNDFLQANGAKITPEYAAFLSGGSTVSDGTVINMYDVHIMSSSLTAATVTSRYGIVDEPDSGYTKTNWLSGNTQLGGSSLVIPTHALEVSGDSVLNGHFVTADAVPPSAVVQANAGTLATCDVQAVASDSSHYVKLVTGSAAFSSGSQCVVSFGHAYEVNPPVCNISAGTTDDPASASRAAGIVSNVSLIVSITGYSIEFTNADLGNNGYEWAVHCY